MLVGACAAEQLVESVAISNGSLARVISDAGEPVSLAQCDRLAHALGLEPDSCCTPSRRRTPTGPKRYTNWVNSVMRYIDAKGSTE